MPMCLLELDFLRTLDKSGKLLANLSFLLRRGAGREGWRRRSRRRNSGGGLKQIKTIITLSLRRNASILQFCEHVKRVNFDEFILD